MARSPAMHWIRTLARNQALAQRLRQDPLEVYKLSLEQRLSRRQVLTGAAALGLTGGALAGVPRARTDEDHRDRRGWNGGHDRRAHAGRQRLDRDGL